MEMKTIIILILIIIIFSYLMTELFFCFLAKENILTFLKYRYIFIFRKLLQTISKNNPI